MKLTLFTFLILTSWGLIAQPDYDSINSSTQNALKHEIGMNIYRISNFGYSAVTKELHMEHNFIIGFMYKFHQNKNALRIGIEYDYRRVGVVEDPEMYYFTDHGERHNGVLSIGYERRFNLNKIQPYIAIDVFAGIGLGNGRSEEWGDFSAHPESQYRTSEFEVGISPTIGVKYQFHEKFSINFETNLNFFFARSTLTFYNFTLYDWYYNTVNHYDEYSYIDNGFERNFSPISILSLNFHFAIRRVRKSA